MRKLLTLVAPWVLFTLVYLFGVLAASVAIYKKYFVFTDLGPFGDFLAGILNPAISLIALWFVAKTYLHQQRAARDANDLLRQSAVDVRRTQMLHRLMDLLDRLGDDLASTDIRAQRSLAKSRSASVNPSRDWPVRRKRVAFRLVEVAAYLRNLGVENDEMKTLVSAVNDVLLLSSTRRKLVEDAVSYIESEAQRTEVQRLITKIEER